jgi:anti-sigma factor RsiW
MRNDMQHPAAERLEAFVEGTLDAGDRAIVESHLLGCPDCQTALDEWKALFAALEGLPQFDPAPGFADRVMAGVKVAPAPRQATRWNWLTAQTAVTAWAGSTAESLSRFLPKSTFGWAMATAFLSLPFVLGAAVMGWLVSKSYITPESLWAFAMEQAAAGVRSLGEAAVATALQTDVALWLLGQGGQLVETAGFTGVGMLLVAGGATTVMSAWVLYRNLFRTHARDTTYASYSF